MLDNLSDKEFENLFRKVSNSQEIDYNPEGWDAMRGVLLKEKRRRRFLWYFLGLAALLLASSTIFLKQDPIAKQSKASEGAQIREQVPIDQSIIVDPINPPDYVQAQANLPDKTELPIEQKESITSDKIQLSHSKGSLSKDTKSYAGKLPKETPSAKGTITNPLQSAVSQNIEALPTQSHLGDTQNISSELDAESKNKEDLKSASARLYRLDRLPSPSLKLIANHQAPKNISILNLAKGPINLENKKPGIAIELALSREWTSTNLSYLKKGDVRVGIKMDIPIFKKLSAGLGLEYYVDRYFINAGEYSPPEGFWTYDVAPLSTYAMCAMLDIPIHLTFHFSGINNPGLFASIGATSINILEETYKYTYEKPNPHLIQEWSGRNTGRQIFNSIRLAGGFKFHVKKQWFATISPYAQIPISGIGFGQVKLYTVGTTLSVRLQKMKK